MKYFCIILTIIALIFFSCKSKKIEQNDNTIMFLSSEEFELKYIDELYHNGWFFQSSEYYLLSDTHIYEYPNFDSLKIGYINIHEKIYIIEDVHNQQTIDDTTSCWYKINYKNMEGYIFGGNIAKETFICDIDRNGINDYFQYRISFSMANNHFDTRKDIIIYINNRKILTDCINIVIT